MTKAEAHRILGISNSASFSRKEQAYRKKQNKLRLHLIPGNSLPDRQKAKAELAKLTTAWQTLQRPSVSTTCKKAAMPKPGTVNPYQKPRTLADAWELLAQLLPLPEPVIAILLITIVFLVLFGLFHSL